MIGMPDLMHQQEMDELTSTHFLVYCPSCNSKNNYIVYVESMKPVVTAWYMWFPLAKYCRSFQLPMQMTDQQAVNFSVPPNKKLGHPIKE